MASERPGRVLEVKISSAAACNAQSVNHATGNAQSGGIHEGLFRLSKNVIGDSVAVDVIGIGLLCQFAGGDRWPGGVVVGSV